MGNESVWKAGRLHIFTEGAVEMKEWRSAERSEGCGLANRRFFEVPETGKLKSLQKIRGGERFYDSVGWRRNTRLEMSSTCSYVRCMYLFILFVITAPYGRWQPLMLYLWQRCQTTWGLVTLPRVFVPDSAWFDANKRCETFILLAKS